MMFTNIKADECEHPLTDDSAEAVFQAIYFMISFFAILWIVGKIFAKLGAPCLVGEIVSGIVLGPNLLNVVPKWDALMVIGDIALVLLVVEAGIGVNIGVLKVVGTRGLMIAIIGSMCPLLIGSLLAFAINPNIALKSAVGIGACFAPTSTGIALKLLRDGEVLNTPTGQLIIAAAVFDDVIALMLLSILQEFADTNPSIIDVTMCFVVSPGLILVFGFIAIKISPTTIKYVMDKMNIKYHDHAILTMLFIAILTLVPACFYAKSSYLLGAFLSGLMFCTDHTIHHVWEKHMKRIMYWLLRLFFACTIGFEIPIMDFFENKKIVIHALIYFIAIIGKEITGIFATNKPIKLVEFLTISFSMSTWCEFAFILTANGYALGYMDQETMSAILLAVLLSVIVSPSLLRQTIKRGQKSKQLYVQRTRNKTITSMLSEIADIVTVSETDTDRVGFPGVPDIDRQQYSPYSSDLHHQIHHVYYCIQTKTYGKWGHQNRLLKCLYSLSLEIIDFRAFNEPQDNYSHMTPFVTDIVYVKDKNLTLLPTKSLPITSKKQLSKRVAIIRNSIKAALQDRNAKIVIVRWLPGVSKLDDMSVSSGINSAFKRNKNKNKKKKKKRKHISPEYARNEAYRQSRMALSYAKLPFVHKLQTVRKNDNENENSIQTKKNVNDDFLTVTQNENDFLMLKHTKDDLLKLSLVAEGDVYNEHQYEETTHTSNISLEIMYGDFIADEEERKQQPLDTTSNNSVPVIVYGTPITPANPQTPLLKEPH